MNQSLRTSEMLDALQRETFDYFVHEVNPLNGLVADRTEEGAPPVSRPWAWPCRPTRLPWQAAGSRRTVLKTA